MNHRLLRNILKKRHITQDKLAHAVGIDRSTLNRKLNGNRGFLVWEAGEIGHFLHLSGEEMCRIFFDHDVA